MINCKDVIDWDLFLGNLRDGILKSGDPWNWVGISKEDPNFHVTPDMLSYVKETSNRLGNFDYSGTRWFIYRKDEHFSSDNVNSIAKFLKIHPTMVNAYKVDPGCNCPIHIDPQDKSNVETWNKLKRFTWQLNESDIGQVLIIGNKALYNLKPFDIYEWESVDQYHGATNCGPSPAYYFLIEGIPYED